MVTLTKIYTRGGDAGMTSLGSGKRRRKDDLRIEAYGAVDEANSCVGVVRAILSRANMPPWQLAWPPSRTISSTSALIFACRKRG
jgi:cob(I)alamin adenosyltransferase